MVMNVQCRLLMRSPTLRPLLFLTAAAGMLCQPLPAEDRLADLVGVARKELQAAKIRAKEIEVRLRIIENLMTLKAYYPSGSEKPEYRNPDHWTTNGDGSYIPKGRPTDAVRDLWQTKSGIRCAKLSALVMVKSLIDVADETRLRELDELLRDKVIPNELPQKGVGTLFSKPKPAKGEIFHPREFLPGDEIWFDNPYFDLLDKANKRRYVGQEGHHVFYVGGGRVVDMYSRTPQTLGVFQTTFLRWGSVRIAAEQEDRKPKASEFQVKAIRRVILP